MNLHRLVLQFGFFFKKKIEEKNHQSGFSFGFFPLIWILKCINLVFLRKKNMFSSIAEHFVL